MGREVDAAITLISQENFFLFTPMLHEVVSSSQSGVSICNPVRKLLKATKFISSRVDHVDLRKKNIFIRAADSGISELAYDHLVLAVGLIPNFFGIPGLEQKALTMKSLNDAVRIRNRLIGCLEQADQEEDANVRQALLTFVIAGGGFTGVETLGAVDDFLQANISRYPSIRRKDLKIVLVHPGDVLIPEMKRILGIYVHQQFVRRRIDVRLGTKVSGVSGPKVFLSSGDVLSAQTIIWTAGNTTTPLVNSLPLDKKQGRIVVNSYLEVSEFPGVWAVGDCAYIADIRHQAAYPPTAQHAVREAEVLAANIVASLAGRSKKSFVYDALGQLANIGHHAGVATILGADVKGIVAWLLWRDVYLAKLPRWEKKIRVWINWILQVFFGWDSVRFLKEVI